MAIYLGNSGFVVFKRTGVEEGLITQVDPADVNTTARRLNFDFGNSEFMTGDLVEFTRLTAAGANSTSNLDFVAASSFPGGAASPQAEWYANVDEQGGVRLYDTLTKAINGVITEAAVLVAPSSAYKVRAVLKNNTYRCFGQLQSYELNTDREVVDVTVLGENMRRSISSLISGSGRMTAFWDYTTTVNICRNDAEIEASNYYHQLVLRQQQGSGFQAQFIIRQPEPNSTEKIVFYEVDALVTDVAISFEPGSVVQSQIEFVTTGNIDLRIQKPTPLQNQLINQTSGAYNLTNSAGRLGLTNP
jgi:hypothetical protein|tara:strand:+ start:5059 stop:5967 length:909 start_codon:yes stop_codon:yes gene_type:complete